MEKNWGYANGLFEKEASIGLKFTKIVASYLNSCNIDCTVNDIEYAETAQEVINFATYEQDIIFDKIPGCLEVKSRRLTFDSNPESYPFKTALVDTVYGWETKAKTPLAVILISQWTNAMLVVPPSTKDSWTHFSSYDKTRKIHETWYECPKSKLAPIEDLVEFLANRQELMSKHKD